MLDVRWKVMRFSCPARDCSHGLEVADHAQRDPESVAATCPCHGQMKCVTETPLVPAPGK